MNAVNDVSIDMIKSDGDGEVITYSGGKKSITGALYLVALVSAYAVFNFITVDGYLPITEGWWQDYSNYINDGDVMYRDFFMYVPPGFPMLMSLICKIFNNSFLALRIFGVVERLILVCVVYAIMRRLFSPRICFFSILAAAALYISNMQDVFYGYYQSSLLLTVVTLYFAIKTYEAFDKKPLHFAAITGAFLAISFFFKHTTGAVFAVAVLITFAAATIRIDRKKSIKCLLYMVAFAAGVAVAVCAVLAAFGAFIPFVEQVFLNASSKGSLFNVLFGFFADIKYESYIAAGVIIACCAMMIICGRFCIKPRTKVWKRLSQVFFFLICGAITAYYIFNTFGGFFKYRNQKTAFLLAVTFVLIIASEMIIYKSLLKSNLVSEIVALIVSSGILITNFLYIRYVGVYELPTMSLHTNRHYMIYTVLFLMGVYCLYLFWMVVIKRDRQRVLPLFIAVCAFVIMYVHGMSGAVESHSLLLSLSLLIATALSVKMPLKWLRNILVYAVCVTLMLTVFTQRIITPYHWWGNNLTTSIYFNEYEPEYKQLAGMKVKAQYIISINTVYDLIESNRKPGDMLYSFPSISLFNVLCDMRSPTFAKTHFFDVCPDDVAIADAKLLLENPPAFILWCDMGKDAFKVHEKLYRAGDHCGQREIVKVYEELVSSWRYTALTTVSFDNSQPVTLYVINDGREIKGETEYNKK